MLGTAISGAFLWIIGLVNLMIAAGIYKIYKELKSGELDRTQLEESAEQAWVSESVLFISVQVSQRTLADLPDRTPVRTGVRYSE